MIEVEKLTKKYGELTAVNNLSFRVEKGMIWGLLGPNAAGKSTTMRILTGYLPATDGKASVGGFDVFDKPDEAKKILGYLPENVPLYPEMTVSGFLGFVSEIKQIPKIKIREAVDKSIQTCGLEKVRGRLIKNISRGFKQRVGLAQALIHDPQILILDEPTIGLDPAQIIEIRQLIKSLSGERTIILSTHILAEVTQTCDGVVIINEGRLMANGSLDELSKSYSRQEGVYIRLRNAGKEAASLFLGIDGVDKSAWREEGLVLEWNRGKKLEDKVLALALDKKLGLVEMRPLAMNIEDLYLKIISGEMEQ
jgi:ABC-2 type transport system ATP-binding protein